MNILYLTELAEAKPAAVPEPNALRTISRLAQDGHRVSLVAFVSDEAHDQIACLKEVCAEVYAVPYVLSRLRKLNSWLRSRISGQPFLIECTNRPGMRSLIRGLLSSQAFDVIHTDKISMMQFALMAHRPDPVDARGKPRINLIPATGQEKTPVILFNLDGSLGPLQEWTQAGVLPIFRPLLSGEMERMKRYEEAVTGLCDHSLPFNEIELGRIYEQIASSSLRSQPQVVLEPA